MISELDFRLQGLILSHHLSFTVTCECNKEEIKVDDMATPLTADERREAGDVHLRLLPLLQEVRLRRGVGPEGFVQASQGYLAHKKQRPPRTLQ